MIFIKDNEDSKKIIDAEKKSKIKQVDFKSSSETILTALSPSKAIEISNVLNWCISSSIEVNNKKLSFTVKRNLNFFKKPTSTLSVSGDLSSVFECLKGNFSSDTVYKRSLKIIDDFRLAERTIHKV